MAKKNENPLGVSCGGGDQEMVAGLFFSQKPGFDLMQNCDLPPPMKIFAGYDKRIVSRMNNVYCVIVGQEDDDVGVEMAYDRSSENEKLELSKALRLSQTSKRGREESCCFVQGKG
ncbi:hypothetical protein ACH5RR_013226 [Cinchona calisaya]|uniref:Uncharacterized protein n=1 Tax=Cinchona calisaya TaxID=153742 RepID=A0ABD3A0S0_9GENT